MCYARYFLGNVLEFRESIIYFKDIKMLEIN